jgi:serine protein kinase
LKTKKKGLKMMNQDFREIVLKQQEVIGPSKWDGTIIEYMQMIQENPEVAMLAPSRIYNMIMKEGVEPVPENRKTKGYEDLVSYNFFKGKIFGSYEAIHDMMKFLKAAARRTETGKRILMLMGPVSSGKSTISTLIKRGLEMDETPVYAIKGCPIHEDPLHVIPLALRAEWNERLGVKIEGDLCPVCQLNLDNNHVDENGIIRWHDIPVELIQLSEQRRCGIGTFTPSDPKSQDITELIGKVNMSKLHMYGESDPRAYQFDGELQVANRGVIEYIEILKADIKFHHVLITLAQEGVIKAPGFPQIYLDELILSHTNQTEFDKFRNDPANEALHDRMYYVKVPWNDTIKDEIQIYKKLIAESEFSDIHISPGALEVAAQFAILTRLYDSKKINLIKKMKLYNGDYLEEFTKGKDKDIKIIREEGRKNGECMSGISPRFITNAINIALGQKEHVETGNPEYKGCITALDMIRALRDNFEHHIGGADKDKETYMNLLTAKEESVVAEYKEFAKKEVSKAFVHAFDDQAEELFTRYDMNCKSFCKDETVFDEVTGEYMEPDEKIMRAIEELIPVPNEAKREFRKGVFVYKADCLESGKKWQWDTYKPIKEAIEKKLMNDLKNVVTLSIANTVSTSEKVKQRRTKALETLKKKGYCENCAKALLGFVGEILRREN